VTRPGGSRSGAVSSRGTAPDPDPFRFEVQGEPVPQGSMRRGAHGTLFHVRGPALTKWRKAIAASARVGSPTATSETFAGALRVSVVFRVPKPVSVRRALPSVRPDLDKLGRAVLDALTGVLYADDGQVVELVLSKRYDSVPGATVEVSVVHVP